MIVVFLTSLAVGHETRRISARVSRINWPVRAKNPGVWMLHCHNLKHAADGLSMHVMYAGATTPFRAGKSAHNDPE